MSTNRGVVGRQRARERDEGAEREEERRSVSERKEAKGREKRKERKGRAGLEEEGGGELGREGWANEWECCDGINGGGKCVIGSGGGRRQRQCNEPWSWYYLPNLVHGRLLPGD